MWGKEHKKWRAHNFSITEESPYQQWFAGNLFQGKLGRAVFILSLILNALRPPAHTILQILLSLVQYNNARFPEVFIVYRSVVCRSVDRALNNFYLFTWGR